MRQSLPQNLTRDDTLALKGVAILLMILHHVLIADFYDKPSTVLSTSLMYKLSLVGKFCVGIYTFVIGYGYAFAARHDAAYAFKHIINLLVRFWPLCIGFFILGLVNGFQLELSTVALNLFGLRMDYNCASWFVYFYIFSMISLPFLAKLIDRWGLKALLVVILLSGIICFFLHKNENAFYTAFVVCMKYCPVLAIGYFVAKTDWAFVKHQFSTLELLLIVLLMIAASGVAMMVMGFCTYTFITPVFALAFAMLLKHPVIGSVKPILIKLGKVSLYMWFIHAVFFSDMTRSIFQQSALWPDNPLLVYLLVASVSFLVACLLMRIERLVVQQCKH